MASTIRTVELPVGAGKTHHMLREMQFMDGIIIYAAPTIRLCEEVYERYLSKEGIVGSNCSLITGRDIEHQSVSERIVEELKRKSEGGVVCCTHAGLSAVKEEAINKVKEKIGVKITIIIDELPSLFKSYSIDFSDALKMQLNDVIQIDDDGGVSIKNLSLYKQVIAKNFYDKAYVDLLRLVDDKLGSNVRMKLIDDGLKWRFYGYELASNFKHVIDLSDEAYLLASTITDTLDVVILKNVWGYKVEPATDIYSEIIKESTRDQRKLIRIFPLLDTNYSKRKALDNDYSAKSGECIEGMVKNAIKIIGDHDAIIGTNKWAEQAIDELTSDLININLIPANSKGINIHQDKHYCCALYTAKPTPMILGSLALLAGDYKLDKKELSSAYVLQYDLDMIAQLCGRTSIRKRTSNEVCAFIVPDKASANHLLQVFFGNNELYDELVDESYMICRNNLVEFNTKIGRPPSVEKKERLLKIREIIEDAKQRGVKLPKQKELAFMLGVKPAQISKDLKCIGEEDSSQRGIDISA